jgi:hypothetical protein
VASVVGKILLTLVGQCSGRIDPPGSGIDFIGGSGYVMEIGRMMFQ